MLVDSVFRGYPLPLFYFEQKQTTDPLGNKSVVLDVIDGQQRIIALTNFRDDHWPLFDPKDAKVALPQAIRRVAAPWAGKTFSALSESLQTEFLETKLPCVIIEEFGTPEEVRDLFIRLQAGTALTRQQVRDAWPGNLGPFVEALAGKLQRKPQYKIFGAIDRRGGGAATDEETSDPYQDQRQTCAQLLCLFLTRSSSGQIPSVSAANLDGMYHQYTDFDVQGAQADEFKRLLGYLDQIMDRRPRTTAGTKTKVSKRDLFALTLIIRDLVASHVVSMDQAVAELVKAAWRVVPDEAPAQVGKVISATAIAAHYRWFVDQRIAKVALVGLDPQRLFSEEQKNEIYQRAAGLCGICQQLVDSGAAEYDHIRPWLLGGHTEVGNGRPVHPHCHLRGLQALTVLVTAGAPGGDATQTTDAN